MKNIRPLVIIPALLLAASGCDAGIRIATPGDFKAATNVTQTAEIPAGLVSMEVVNLHGKVRITGTTNGPTGWTWKLTARGRSEADATEAAAAAKCSATREGDHLKLEVTLPNSDGKWNYTSDLEIRVPASLAMEARNGFGDLEVAQLSGDVVLENQHGKLLVRDVSGKVNAQTSFADLAANTIGPARLRNQHGEIEVEKVAGELDAETSFSSLKAADIKGAARVRNQHGSIEVRTASALDARTSYGPLLASEIAGEAKLANQHGKVSAQIGGSVAAESSFASLDILAGGPRIDCRNEHGKVTIRSMATNLTSITAQTTFGALELKLPAALKPAMQAQTSFGEIESDLPVLMKAKGKDPFENVPEETPRVRLQNQHGDIRVIAE